MKALLSAMIEKEKNMTKAGTIEYKMPEEVVKQYLKMRNAEEKKMTPNEYLCKIVNEQYGLLGKCVRVIRY